MIGGGSDGGWGEGGKPYIREPKSTIGQGQIYYVVSYFRSISADYMKASEQCGIALVANDVTRHHEYS